MMDTILNLGLNDEAAQGLARTTGNERFARMRTGVSSRCAGMSSTASMPMRSSRSCRR